MKIACFHLFNDYSGSPKVLSTVLQGLLEHGCSVDLYTSRGGVLDSLADPKLRVRHYPYTFSTNPVKTMVAYTLVQFYTFALALRYLFKGDVTFYINTLLPAGPALAGRLMGKKVVYHYHENATVKSGFYRLLARVMQCLATEIICVSAYQASFLKARHKVTVVPNTLPDDFRCRLKPDAEAAFGRKRVLMLSSLKDYKGTKEFIDLARQLPQYNFSIVINDTPENIDSYLAANHISCPDNLAISSRQPDVSGFYNETSMVLNLSNPDEFIETFGLTALEAMTAGLPVIVPTVGGIAEMVTDDVNGYKIDVQDLEKIRDKIDIMLSDKDLYMRLSRGALEASKAFSQHTQTEKIYNILK